MTRVMGRFMCWLFHQRYWSWYPIHHSWGWTCSKCEREGIAHD